MNEEIDPAVYCTVACILSLFMAAPICIGHELDYRLSPQLGIINEARYHMKFWKPHKHKEKKMGKKNETPAATDEQAAAPSERQLAAGETVPVADESGEAKQPRTPNPETPPRVPAVGDKVVFQKRVNHSITEAEAVITKVHSDTHVNLEMTVDDKAIIQTDVQFDGTRFRNPEGWVWPK